MTDPSGIGWGVDVYRAVFFPINTSGGIDHPGYPTLAAADAYEGLEFTGPKSLSLNLGAPRAVTNVAQGRVQDTIYLPSIEAKTAEFHLSYIDQLTFAALSSVKTGIRGAGRYMPFGTDKQGLEIDGIFMISQLAFHDGDGVTQWHNYILPRARGIVNMPSFDENAIDVTVNLSLSASTKHVWGAALSEANDGALKMHGLDHLTWDRFNIVAWLADGAEDEFLFPTNKQAVSTFANSFEVWDYNAGTEITANITKSATGVKFTSAAPAASKLLIGIYEY
jgi:hypothetical protein